MNWEQVQGNWKQFKGKAQQVWGDLTDDEMDHPREARGARRPVAEEVWLYEGKGGAGGGQVG